MKGQLQMKTMRSKVMRWAGSAAIVVAAALFGVSQAEAQITPGGPGARPQGGDAKPTAIGDLNTTMTLALNNVNLEQLMKFLGEATGKSVIKNKTLQTQVNVSSPVPVTKREALRLIYEALKMDNIAVVESDDMIQIVPTDAIKNMPFKQIEDTDNLKDMPDSTVVAQRIYHLKHVTAENIRTHLEKFVPESSMTIDAKNNTVVITDQITRLKRYDSIIKSLDTPDIRDRVIEIFKLKNADAIELSLLLGNVLLDTNTGKPTDPRQTAAMRTDYTSSSSSRRYSSRDRGSSVPITVGEVTIVPDPRMNWLIVSCPKLKLSEIAKLIDEFDKPEDQDVKTRMIKITHTEAETVATVVTNLYRQTEGGAAKDVIRAVPAEEGNTLVVMSSAANFAVIEELVKRLDTESAEKRETRTYQIKHVEVQDLADQLQNLYDMRSGSATRSQTYYYGGGPQQSTSTKPTFVASPRTTSLMVLARPRDFDFIEQMIKELDVAMDSTNFEPRIYHIHHTDAGELVKVLETLFGSGTSNSNRSQGDYFWRQTSASDKDAIQATFGLIRFVVDSTTNTIVALSSNRKNYDILDAMIMKLDTLDPESTEMLVYDLKYADAFDVADQINNLFSDGPVQRPGTQQAPQNQNQTPTSTTGATATTAQTNTVSNSTNTRQIIYPWQSTQRQTNSATQTPERPINTMIGNIRVVPDTRSNKILVAAPAIYFPTIKGLIENLDSHQPQVYIATRIVELTRGNERRVGLRWTPDPASIDPAELDNAILGLGQLGILQGFGKTGPSSTTSTDTTTGHSVTSTSPSGIQVNNGSSINGITQNISKLTGSANSVLGANVNAALLVQLLVKNDLAEVISEPKITVNNNQLGNIFVGNELPFRTNTQVTDVGSTNFGTEYREVGIKLNVTPHINLEGEVVLTADLENSALVAGELIDGQVVTNKTTFHTEVAVASKETMVIGGILVESKNAIKRGVPYLSKIPVLGALFRKSDDVKSTRELVVFITPEVLNAKEEHQEILYRAKKELEEIRSEDKPGPVASKSPAK